MLEDDGDWFIAVCYFVAKHDGVVPADDALYEEVHYLVRAEYEDEALEVAKSLAEAAEHSYKNSIGEEIQWESIGVVEVMKIDADLSHGSEVFSRFLDSAAYEGLRHNLESTS